MLVLSWNVLFREYEEKYHPKSAILSYTEDQRLHIILDFVEKSLDIDTVICLQECSTPLIDSLKNIVSSTYTIYTQKARNEDFLVTICATRHNFFQEELIHPTARGYLVISNSKYRVVNCHLVPQKYCEQSVMGFINQLPTDRITVVAGDFNEYYKKVSYKLGSRYTVPRFGKTYKRREIDFIIIDRPIKYRTETVPFSISDHHAIRLYF